MNMTFTNEFHHTEASIKAIETALCGPEGLETLCAYFTEAQLKKVGKELCGIDGCCCGGWTGNWCDGEDGKKYYVQVSPDKNPAAVALGRLGGSAKSERKAKSSAENGKKGGWPKGRPRKKAEAPQE